MSLLVHTFALALPLALLIITAAPAQPSSVESQIQKRQTSMRSLASAMQTMQWMVFGMIPLEPKAFAAAAERLGVLAADFPNLFPVGSDQGKTNARPEIWTNAVEFEAAGKGFQDTVAPLRAAAGDGDLDRMKAAVSVADRTCAACHSRFVIGR